MSGRLRLAVKLASGAALLALLIVIVDGAALRDVLGKVNHWILLSLPVFYVHTAVKAQRWRVYLRAQGVTLRFPEANRMYLSGTFLGLVSPGRVGEVYRAWLLHRERGVNPGLGIASVLVDRLSDIAVLLVLGGFGLLFLVQQGIGGVAPALAAPLIPDAGRRKVAAYLRRQFKRLIERMPAPVAKELPGAYRVFMASIRSMGLGLLIHLFLLTLLSILVYCLHLYFIARVLGLPIGFLELTGVLCASTFVNLVPITLNAIGTRDAFLVATLPLLGVDRAAALGFSLMFLLLFVANGLMSLPFWLYGRRETQLDGNDA